MVFSENTVCHIFPISLGSWSWTTKDFEFLGHLSKEVIQNAEETFGTYGTEGYLPYLREKLEEWKEVPLNVGILGESGCGKSTIINTLRGLFADDVGAAEIGLGETTKVPTPYLHPNNPMLKFWDLPGMGTVNFPQDQYLEKIAFSNPYDFYLILSESRFTERDAWLGRKITERGKKFYYVRTKMGSAIENDLKGYRDKMKYDVEKAIKRVRNEIASNLENIGIKAPFFLIDSYERTKYDFGHLEQTLIQDLPELKKEAMVLSLG